MRQFKRSISILLLILLPLHSSFAQDSNKTLTIDEKELLNRGEISDGQYIAGGVVGTFFGLGIGNAIQGTYMPRGLLFTLGELVGGSLLMVGLLDCIGDNLLTTKSCTSGSATAGGILLIGFRVWEIIDVWTTPPSINRQIKNIRERTGVGHPTAGIAPVTKPDGSLSGAQFSLKFEF